MLWFLEIFTSQLHEREALKSQKSTCLKIREGMKELFGKYGTVIYVDFQRGDVSGYVRMETKDGTAKIMEEYAATKDSFQLGGQTFELRLLAGEEEKAYIEKVEEGRRERRERSNKKRRNKYSA